MVGMVGMEDMADMVLVVVDMVVMEDMVGRVELDIPSHPLGYVVLHIGYHYKSNLSFRCLCPMAELLSWS